MQNVHAVNTPVLLIVFNRPATTRRVFESIRAARPKRLYVAADGPRADRVGEAQLAEEARKIATNVDWPCEVKTLFREQNIGCQHAVTGAIDWVFKNEEQAIILEDDCVPSPAFYQFCEEMLATYENDERVMHVGGYTVAKMRDKASYRASKFVAGWGWATWRRAWKKFDLNIDPATVFTSVDMRAIFGSQAEILRSSLLSQLTNTQLSVWDVQWFLSILANGGVSIMPATSLIKNVGFGADATHTREISHLAKIDRGTLTWPLVKPLELRPDPRLDEEYLKIVYHGADFLTRVVRKLQVWSRR